MYETKLFFFCFFYLGLLNLNLEHFTFLLEKVKTAFLERQNKAMHHKCYISK